MHWYNALQTDGTLLGPWSYIVLAFLVAVEGPIATLIGAAAASANAMHLPGVFMAAAMGNLVADTLWYTLGYFGQIKIIYRFGKWIGVKPEQIAHLEGQVHRNAIQILLVAKLTAGLVIPSLVAAGLLKIPWRKWFLPIFVAEMIWTGTLIVVGYHATQWIREIEHGIQIFAVGATLLVALIIIYRMHRKKIRVS
jgi:membrane protein DedA with SNARE-associated domain